MLLKTCSICPPLFTPSLCSLISSGIWWKNLRVWDDPDSAQWGLYNHDLLDTLRAENSGEKLPGMSRFPRHHLKILEWLRNLALTKAGDLLVWAPIVGGRVGFDTRSSPNPTEEEFKESKRIHKYQTLTGVWKSWNNQRPFLFYVQCARWVCVSLQMCRQWNLPFQSPYKLVDYLENKLQTI